MTRQFQTGEYFRFNRAYLFGSELWALYIDRRTAHVNRKYTSWILGLNRVRDDRLTGWLPLKDLDIKGEAAVVRMVCEVSAPGSMLHYACFNFSKTGA